MFSRVNNNKCYYGTDFQLLFIPTAYFFPFWICFLLVTKTDGKIKGKFIPWPLPNILYYKSKKLWKRYTNKHKKYSGYRKGGPGH